MGEVRSVCLCIYVMKARCYCFTEVLDKTNLSCACFSLLLAYSQGAGLEVGLPCDMYIVNPREIK